MKKFVGVAAAALMTVTALAGCGGDDSSSSSGNYCDDVKTASTAFIGLSGNDITQAKFEAFLTALHGIRDEAPSEIKADWTTFSSAADKFSAALDKAGFTMDDLASMQDGDMGDTADMAAVMAAAQSMGSAAVSDAQANISAQVKEDCDVDLNAS